MTLEKHIESLLNLLNTVNLKYEYARKLRNCKKCETWQSTPWFGPGSESMLGFESTFNESCKKKDKHSLGIVIMYYKIAASSSSY
jgi:hypothetical protein